MATSSRTPNPNPMRRNPKKLQGRPRLRDRFDAMVRDMRRRGPVGTPEITRLYNCFMLQLNRNSRPLILELTAIAGKYQRHVDGIANAIMDRIVKVPVEQKLPSWYLLDSIAKHVGDQYRAYFAGRLYTIFIDTYDKLCPSLRPSLDHLSETWKECIPSFARGKIKEFLEESRTSVASGNLSDFRSQSPHLLLGDNSAKFLDHPHQTEHSAVDAQQRRLSPSLLSYRQKHQNDHELLPLCLGNGGVGSSAIAGIEYKLSEPRPSSHSRIGQKLDSFSERVADRPSSCVFGSGRPIDVNVELARGWPDGAQNSEASLAHYCKNECGKLHTRLLNDSYGSKDAFHEKLSKFQKLDSTDIGSNMPMKESESSEEEFVWETMSPTFPRKQHNSTSFGHITNLSRSNAPYLGHGSGNNWHNQSADIVANPGRRAFRDRFRDDIASLQESMLQSWGSYHDQEPSKLSNESQGRTAPLEAISVSPHLMPQNFCYAQTQGAVFRPNLFNSLSEIIPPNPSLQSSLPTSQPLYLPSFHLSPPYLPPAVAPPRFPPAAVASHPLVAAAPPTPHRPGPPTTPPQPAPHNSAFPHNPLLPHPFNPAHTLSILPPHVTTKGNSQNFTYLCSSPVSRPPLGPLAASSPTPPIYGSTIAHIAESPASAFPGLLSCIVAQGPLSCPSCLSKDGLIDFHAGFLNVRHEPSINALYDDLPKQCGTCGMRFISQEDLSGHMEWHLTENGISSNQNHKPSCNWYVNANEWLSGLEALSVVWKH